VSKWYIREPDSERALAFRRQFAPPAVLTPLHRLELSNAWQLKVFRGELVQPAALAAREHLLRDFAAGVWVEPPAAIEVVPSCAERLALDHSATVGTRSLDVIHVASALTLGCTDFVTGDVRQGRLAKAVGLRVHVP
jgi:hypothetical protein